MILESASTLTILWYYEKNEVNAYVFKDAVAIPKSTAFILGY